MNYKKRKDMTIRDKLHNQLGPNEDIDNDDPDEIEKQ